MTPPPTLESSTLDFQGFFAGNDAPLERISCREVDRCIDALHQQGFSPATINRRLSALKHVFDVLNDQPRGGTTPVKASHGWRRSRALPRALSQEPLAPLLSKIQHHRDKALFLLMLRCGLRVSEVAQLTLKDIDWSRQAVLVEQGKGRKNRRG
jgi:site-specific recombinase XerC